MIRWRRRDEENDDDELEDDDDDFEEADDELEDLEFSRDPHLLDLEFSRDREIEKFVRAAFLDSSLGLLRASTDSLFMLVRESLETWLDSFSSASESNSMLLSLSSVRILELIKLELDLLISFKS